MGKSLGIKPSGTHVAFTAGTGCLVFVDLVAFLVKQLLDLLEPGEESPLDPDAFKFVLYMSFRSREESVALTIC